MEFSKVYREYDGILSGISPEAYAATLVIGAASGRSGAGSVDMHPATISSMGCYRISRWRR